MDLGDQPVFASAMTRVRLISQTQMHVEVMEVLIRLGKKPDSFLFFSPSFFSLISKDGHTAALRPRIDNTGQGRDHLCLRCAHESKCTISRQQTRLCCARVRRSDRDQM